MKKLLAQYTQEYKENLPSSLGEKYLLGRGISKEAQSYFHLGFVVDPVPEQSLYSGMISIPYLVGGNVVGIKYRQINDSEPKYLYSSGFYARRIFNPDILKMLHPKIYVCEGEIDAITLDQLRVPAIAIPGANNWNPILTRVLRNRRVVVLADGDGKPGKGKEAGKSLGKQILSSIDDSGMIVMVDTDVNEYYCTHGEQALLTYIGWKND